MTLAGVGKPILLVLLLGAQTFGLAILPFWQNDLGTFLAEIADSMEAAEDLTFEGEGDDSSYFSMITTSRVQLRLSHGTYHPADDVEPATQRYRPATPPPQSRSA